MTTPDIGADDVARQGRRGLRRRIDPWTGVAALASAAAVILVAVHWVSDRPADWVTPAVAALAGLAAATAGVALYRATLALVAEATRGTKETRRLAEVAALGVAQARELTEATREATAVARQAAWLDVHERLRPQFKAVLSPNSRRKATLILKLDGPDSLDKLDELEVSIRNDSPSRIEWDMSPGEKAIRRQWIFSPWKFKTSSDGGRSSEPEIPFEKDESYVWHLVATNDPRPQPESDELWLEEMNRSPFKIKVTSTLHGDGKPHVWITLMTPKAAPPPPPLRGADGAE